jgi:pseudaminic acid synthase
MNAELVIEGRSISGEHPAYVIAELSANHGQKFDQAMDVIRAAKTAGADAIKLQTYTADTLTLDCNDDIFRVGKGTLWEGKNLYQLYSEAYTPWEWQPKLKQAAEELGLACFSTPFDFSAVEFLEQINMPAFKIASFELVDLPLVRRIAKTGKPTIISTGMASFTEIEEAVQAFREAGGRQFALLKCTSGYPASADEMNLRTIQHMRETFQVPVGLSDHTLGIAVPIAAVAMGACIIEKHLTLSRSAPGPDSAFSLEPQEFTEMVQAIRIAEQALGTVRYEPTPMEETSRIFRRSLFAVENIAAGEALTSRNIRSIRPGNGLAPKFLDQVLGRKARVFLKKGTPLNWDLVS